MPAGPPPPYAAPPYAQQPYPQPPAYWPVYPSPPRRRRRWLPWAIAAGVLTVGGCGAVIATVGVSAFQQMQGAREAADEFLSAIERGDTDAAQDLLCDEAAPDAVQRAQDSGPVQHRIVTVAVLNTNFGSDPSDHASATVTVDVLVAGGERHRDVLDLQHEHDRWAYCGVIRSEVRD